MSKAKTTASNVETLDEPAPREVYFDGKQFVTPTRNRFFTGFAPVTLHGVVVKEGTPALGLVGMKPFSYEEWCHIVAYHRWSVKTYSAETMLSHLITADGEWMHVPFHQSVRRGAMTISVDYQTPDNLALMTKLEQEHGISTGDFHGSTHNHVRTSAFASGTDSDDETNKQGIHITVGKMDKPQIDIHARIRMIFPPKFDDVGERIQGGKSILSEVKGASWAHVVDVPGYHPSLPEDVAVGLLYHHLTKCPDDGFPDEWKDFVTENKTTVGYQGRGGTHGGFQGGVGAGKQSGMGFRNTWPWNSSQSVTTSPPSPSAGKLPNGTSQPTGARLITTADKESETEKPKTGAKVDEGNKVIARPRFDKYRCFFRVLLLVSSSTAPWSRIKEWIMQDSGKWVEKADAYGIALSTLSDVYSEVQLQTACSYLEDLFAHQGYKPKEVYSTSASNRKLINLLLDKVDAAAEAQGK